MLEMQKQPGFTYSACGSFTKNKERIQKFKEKGDTKYIYVNDLDKVCFQPYSGWAFSGLPTDRGDKKAPPFAKICHTYPTMMKLDSYTSPKEDLKNIWITWRTSKLLLKSAYRLHFSTLFLVLLAFLESLKTCLINLVIVFMMSAKMATPCLLKIKIFWNKGCDGIISVHDVTNEILSRGSNYIADVLMWPKFGNCSISMRKFITISIL